MARSRLLPSLALLAAIAAAQPPVAPPPPSQAPSQAPTRAEVGKAIEAWLDGAQADQAALDKTVQTVLAGDDGLAQVGVILAACTEPAEKRTKGIQDLATHAALAFVKQQAESKMQFVGQYDPLLPLQPFVGRLFTVLLLRTPQWYPHTHRGQLVPALRDLFVTAPGPEVLEGVIAIVQDTEREPEALRTALACALHQWGRKEFIQPRLLQLQQDGSDGPAEGRADFVRQLAELHYALRQWRQSAASYEALLVIGGKNGAQIAPTDWYGAACAHSLAGNRERALRCLEACAELNVAAGLDPSLKMERKVWERDRDLQPLRGEARFQQAFAKAFGAGGAAGKGK